MKIYLTVGLIMVCHFLCAQNSYCTHELMKDPSIEQVEAGKDLLLQADGSFVIIQENLTLDKANGILAELSAVEESGGALDARYLGIVSVLNCMIDNEMIE